jgi:transcription initiation factor IIE alpha subunit
MANLKAYVVSGSNDGQVVNMTELEVIEVLKDEVSELKAQIGELNKAETEA